MSVSRVSYLSFAWASLRRAVATLLLALPPALALVGAAGAQASREIPASALKGTLTPLEFPLVRIDGRTLRLAPGAQIFGPTRSMLTPNQVKADTPVRYVLDGQGHVRRVWIVDEKNAATPRTGPQERTGPQQQ